MELKNLIENFDVGNYKETTQKVFGKLQKKKLRIKGKTDISL